MSTIKIVIELRVIDATKRVSRKPNSQFQRYPAERVAKIKELRASGLTYKQIAKKIGTSAVGYVYRLANDKTSRTMN